MISLALTLVLTPPLFLHQDKPVQDYKTTIEEWRANRAKNLQKPEGWLSVAGLFWLSEGANSMGSAEGSKVLLPSHSSPAQAGTLTLTGEKVVLTPMSGVALLVNDQPVTGETQLHTDAEDKTDTVKLGEVSFYILKRGQRTGVRMYDPKAEGRVNFKGLHWFPIDEKMVVEANFVPYDPPKPATIMNIIGDATPTKLPGYLEFKVNGKDCRLDVEEEGDQFFLNFQDKTSGKTTYPAGRFLYTPKAVNNKVTIDFNKAYNPPCAYTAFATCPLPPDGNKLDVEIKAGEMAYHAK